jgi:energy-coupling factor transporter ATP-binding protein EcfA2
MKVIALTGRAGSGKDTAAQLLQVLTGLVQPYYGDVENGVMDISRHLDRYKDYGYKFHTETEDWPVLKFAYPVYQIVAVLVGRDVDNIMGDPNFKNQVQAWGLTGRQLLQKVGTECFREVIGTTVWIDIMQRTLDRFKYAVTSGVIISDLRFLNEAGFIDRIGGTIIKIGGRDAGVPGIHQSESEISDIVPSYLLDNSGNYVDLMDGLALICKELNIFNCKYTWK